MSFGKKDAGDIFKYYYNRSLKILKSANLGNNLEFEVLPLMFVICDFTAAMDRLDRYKIANDIMPKMPKIYKRFDYDKFNKRLNLYGEVIHGKELRGELFHCNPPATDDNPLLAWFILFSDLVYNPACADDYDNAPLLIGDVFDTFKKSTYLINLMPDMLRELRKMGNEISNLYL